MFELFLARAKNELKVTSSRLNFPLASVSKSSVTWKLLFSVSLADKVTDILLFGFKPVLRYEICRKWFSCWSKIHFIKKTLFLYSMNRRWRYRSSEGRSDIHKRISRQVKIGYWHQNDQKLFRRGIWTGQYWNYSRWKIKCWNFFKEVPICEFLYEKVHE